MAGNVVAVECRTREGPNCAAYTRVVPVAPNGCVVQVRPEHCHRGLECHGTPRSLSPTYHLRIQPCGLHRVRPCRTFPPEKQIPAAFTRGTVGRNLETPIQRPLDDIGADPYSLRLRQNVRRLGAILRLFDELSGAECGPKQGCNNFRILL